MAKQHLPLLFSFFASTYAYTWPSPQLDALEGARWEQPLHFFLRPCNAFDFDPNGAAAGRASGRSNAADWIRTAYHDMATFNKIDQTGGLDGSIRFAEEQARAENIGDGFANTLSKIVPFSNRYVSVADIIALGAVIAFETCGGPEITFRGGRVDATEPNTAGVPKPDQELDSHIASFEKQGFTKEEMIGLVACGHSFGGVQHASFPDIVPELNDPENTQSSAHFDTTPVNFDNKIATEYMSGTTLNPLVVGHNDTTNSDKRIFGSDGNVTMRGFADSLDAFASTCATLIARMIDTVPAGVKLTEVFTPLPVKPTSLDLILVGDKIQFSGQVRIWNATRNTSPQVRLLWADHTGSKTNNATLPFNNAGDSSNERNSWVVFKFGTNSPFQFITLDAVAGITNMRFAVNDKIEDQGGLGFPVLDDIFFSSTSCYTGDHENPSGGRFDIAVRNGANPTRVYLEKEIRDATGRTTIQEIDVSPPTTSSPSGSPAFSIWSYNPGNDPSDLSAVFTIGAEVNGVKATRSSVQRAVTQFTACA
ncbi:peroxidase [Favolaschia claudopus]|uniref:Peroxidase n=1 Tax=Favolaschia claudopus TaxID=2862362 RepID=A0AAW0BVD5_9AGAR